MRAATSEQLIRSQAVRSPGERRPRLRVDHPCDLVDDPRLSPAEKRALLSSWASDASAVQEEPTLRWLLGTPKPIPLDDIRTAFSKLDFHD